MRRLLNHRASASPGALTLAAVLLLLWAYPASAQFGFRGRRNDNPAAVLWGLPDVPGEFFVCRLMYATTAYDPSASGWSIEYPRADINFMTRISQLTTTEIAYWRDGRSGGMGHTVVRASDPELFQCPWLVMASPGSTGFSDAEAEALRQYLLKGGFLWADDFWGDGPWYHWMGEIDRILPEYAVVDLPIDHPLFSLVYHVPELPQIPSLNRWRPGMPTAEFPGPEYATPHARAIFDESGRMLVFMTHNTDIADGFEREDDLYAYFEAFAWQAYALGINVAVWAMTR